MKWLILISILATGCTYESTCFQEGKVIYHKKETTLFSRPDNFFPKHRGVDQNGYGYWLIPGRDEVVIAQCQTTIQ